MLLSIIVVEIITVFVLLHIYNKFVSDPKNFTSVAVVSQQSKKTNQLEKINQESAGQSVKNINSLPKKFLIENVPFSIQSPDSLWDEVGEESCEEASMIIVDHFWKKKPLDRKIMLEERNKLVNYEIATYGDFRDENSQEIAERLRNYFAYQNVQVIYDFSLTDLKKKLIEGRPIILPTAGRLLGNPYFTQPGPLYHNLVAIGYDGSDIIVHDPGVGRGENYRYNEDVLYNAIHDFPGSKERIQEGRKAMILVAEEF